MDVANYRIKRLLSGVRYAFYANVMLRLWRPRVTNYAIVSPRSQLQAVLTVAIPGEARSLKEKNSAICLHFYFTGKHFFIYKKQNYFITFS